MSRILKLGTQGTDVADLQRRLNCTSPTRLPRLVDDGDYGSRTMARVMEFQFQNGLTTDGAAGPLTMGSSALKAGTCTTQTAPTSRCIVADLINRRLRAYKDGKEEHLIAPIMGGSLADPSTRGVFKMSSRRLRHHTSSKFPIPPDNMQFALFYNGGEAIHLGPPDLPSHGCIHVGNPGAEQIFNFAGKNDVLVIVLKSTP